MSFYGSYPPTYLARAMALFPDVKYPDERLHAFSGSLPKGDYVRCDSVQDAELRGRVEDLPRLTAGTFRLVLADPPYTKSDAEKYGTPPLNRRAALAALAEVTRSGGHLVWLDTVWPMHSKRDWRTVGRILLVRSTNHRVRLVSLFERVA